MRLERSQSSVTAGLVQRILKCADIGPKNTEKGPA